jgi:Na+-transporting methylmalonyl-CoA/oxaloacetate decarboxylase gamma subunit
LDAIYNLIRLFIVGLGFVFIALLSILRWTLRI